ncbi:MAG: TraB/GumN family protein [Verrucomicrobiota bacterium]
MKHLIPVIALLSVIAPLSVCAQEAPKHPVKPLLWKIEGGDLKKPSYLFGTIHLGGGALNQLHPAAQKAFEESDVVLTEIPMDDKTQLGMAMKVIRKDGKTLAESIGEELSKQLDEELRAINPALDSKPFQPMHTWAIAVSLPMLKSQLTGATALDKKIWDAAVKKGKKTDAMETADFQVGLLSSFTEQEQVNFLSETLRYMRKDRAEGKNSLKELTDAYIQGDADLIKKLVEKSFKEMLEGPHKELGEKFFDKLLTQRDKTMAATIAQKLKASPDTVHFFAAGTAHFTGDPSIRSHLEKAGYRVTRIEN